MGSWLVFHVGDEGSGRPFLVHPSGRGGCVTCLDYRQDFGGVGWLAGFNIFHDLFDALVFQDRLPRNCCPKFLATGAPFPECKSWKRLHGPGSVEGWILVEADSADACYEHAAEWAECLDWEVTPVLTDEQAGL